MIGGVCVNTGTIPSKTLREAVLYLTGLDQREMYGQSYRVKDDITIADLAARTRHVVSRENDVVRSQLTRNRIAILPGLGRFAGPDTLEIDDGTGRVRTASAANIVIATGTRPARPASVAFDERTVIDSDGIDAPGAGAADHGGGRRRGDRHRVRLDVRRAGHQGHRGRAARPDAGVLRPGSGRGAQVPPARPGRDVPVRRDRGRGGGPPRRRDGLPEERQEDPGRDRHVLRGPAGHDRGPEPGGGRADRGQPRPDQGGRALPHRGAAASTRSAT